jgi:hypothetical protein
MHNIFLKIINKSVRNMTVFWPQIVTNPQKNIVLGSYECCGDEAGAGGAAKLFWSQSRSQNCYCSSSSGSG